MKFSMSNSNYAFFWLSTLMVAILLVRVEGEQQTSSEHSKCNLTLIDLSVNETMATPESNVVYEPKASEACAGAQKSFKTLMENIPNCLHDKSLQKLEKIFEEFKCELPPTCNGSDLQEYMTLTECWSQFYSDPEVKLINNHLVAAVEKIAYSFPSDIQMKAVCVLPVVTIEQYQPLAIDHCTFDNGQIIMSLKSFIESFYSNFCGKKQSKDELLDKLPEPYRSQLENFLDFDEEEEYQNQWETSIPVLLQLLDKHQN